MVLVTYSPYPTNFYSPNPHTMKKIFLPPITALMALSVNAQTDFRSISFDEALKAAKAENKLVFIDFYTDWCGPCKMMMRDVFPQKMVGDYMNSKFVCIKLNAEKEGQELAKYYKVNAYPTFIAVDADKKTVMTKVGGGGAQTFIDDIDRLIDPDKSPERLKSRYEDGERTPELISAYASLKMAEAREDRKKHQALKKEAFDLVNNYFNGLSDNDKLSAKNLFVYKSYTQSPFDVSARFMIAHRNDFEAPAKEEINKIIEELYEKQVYNYFNGYTPYDEANYKQLRKDIDEIQLNTDKKYDTCFRFIECHAQRDLSAYLDLCEKEYTSMPQELKRILTGNFAALIQTQDEAIRSRASRFIRSHLAEMSLNELYFIPEQLNKLEGQGH